jgi:multidrug efflux system membrane fusion protein
LRRSSVCPRRRWRALPTAVVPLLAVVGLLTGCRDTVPDTADVTDDDVAVVRIDTTWSGPAFIGTVTSRRVLRVRAENPGTLAAVAIEVGEEIAAGALLARFDDRTARDQMQVAQAAVTQAESSLAQTTRELERVGTLLDIGAIALREREVAERSVLGARSQVAEARAHRSHAAHMLQQTVFRAPFAAVVTDAVARAGDVVAAGAPLFTLADNRQLSIEAFLPVTTASTLDVGAPVRLFLVDDTSRRAVNDADASAVAYVTRLSRVVDPQTRQVRVSIALPSDGPRLLVGQTLHGRLAGDAHVGILVPERAIDRSGDMPMVALIRRGAVVRTAVTLGDRDEDTHQITVLGGVTPGDSMLIGDARRTASGVAVRYRRRASAISRAPVGASDH